MGGVGSGGKPKVYPTKTVDRVRFLYASGITQAEIANEIGCTQKVVWNLMRRHGIDGRTAAKRDQRGEKNDNWRGGRTICGSGYAHIYLPDHHRARANGYVCEHIVVAETKIGRPLAWHGPGDARSEIVHHIDGDKLNNSPDNIEVTNYAAHLDFHRDTVTGRNLGVVKHAR